MPELKRTPFYEEHKRIGAKFVEFGGWEMPLWFKGIIEEHNATRSSVGVFDVSHMGRFLVTGPDTVPFINYMITNDFESIKPGEIVYSPLCNFNGGIIDDLVAMKFSDQKALIVVNAANIEKDFDWFVKNSEKFDVNIKNISSELAMIAYQGPKAEESLMKISQVILREIKYYHFTEGRINGIYMTISRTGYTGEDGFELFVERNAAVTLWRRLIDIARKIDGMPAGLGARDTLRLEATYLLYGNDMTEETTPLEVGLKWAVKFEKDKFIGKEALLKQKEEGIKRRLKGLEILDKRPARHGYKVFSGEKEIGVITSGTTSPTLKKNIALALIEKEFSKTGTELEIDVRGKRIKAKVVKTPFYRGSVKTRK